MPYEVTLRRLVNEAMRSDPRAIKLLLTLVERYAESPETAFQLGEVLAEDQAILAQYWSEPAGPGPDSPMSSDEAAPAAFRGAEGNPSWSMPPMQALPLLIVKSASNDSRARRPPA
jgi:hypothetical protein